MKNKHILPQLPREGNAVVHAESCVCFLAHESMEYKRDFY